MAITIIFTCDVCGKAHTPVAADREMGMPCLEGWAQVSVELSERVLPKTMDHFAATLANGPANVSDIQAAYLDATIANPFNTALNVCPDCRKSAMGPLDAVIVARLKERVEKDAPSEPPLPQVIPFLRPLPPEEESGFAKAVEKLKKYSKKPAFSRQDFDGEPE